MQYYITVIPFLVSLSALRLHAYSSKIFSKDTTIAYPETGLFLDYVGMYTPSEKIIHNSAIFPMTPDTCHFLPSSAVENIPSCNITAKTRRKRFIDSIVSVGIGAASLALSVSNTIQIENLQQQVALVENTLSKFSQTVKIHGAQLAKLTLKHIELTEQLEITQEAIDEILPVLDKHSEAITTLKTGIEHLQFQLRHSFLYLAITQICNNELTLDFLSPEDIRKVVYNVIKLGNLTFNSYPGSLPVVQIITKLLVRQQIDFISKSQYITNDPDEIGRLVITSFFAVPRQEQIPFYVYKLLTIPFFHENETIELAQIPRYWAINSINNTTMEWHHPQEFGCDLRLMTSCRDTPPIRTISNDTCLNQIIERLPLSRCQTAPIPGAKYFVRQLRDNFWVTSSSELLHCVKIPSSEYLSTMQQTWNMNEEIILPSVSLVYVTEGHTVACPGFTLVGRPVSSNTSSLIILHSNDVLTKNISVMNVHQYITKNMTWLKKKMSEQEKHSLMDFMRQTNAISSYLTPFSTYMQSFGMLTFSWFLFGLSAALIYYIYRRKRKTCQENL
ncbi:unnamed protein product [Rotaria socialis]|uniref:Uncharacterized protein n=1 Tax=Rotaria socialis TaxID=392032 RepID=A0A820WTW8_9BILA|nr:unnamed protein product [Rotaria socialis]CAF4521225.1 unnamed protein product [Rotaria socialis]